MDKSTQFRAIIMGYAKRHGYPLDYAKAEIAKGLRITSRATFKGYMYAKSGRNSIPDDKLELAKLKFG